MAMGVWSSIFYMILIISYSLRPGALRQILAYIVEKYS